jgi:hypothetical protein
VTEPVSVSDAELAALIATLGPETRGTSSPAWTPAPAAAEVPTSARVPPSADPSAMPCPICGRITTWDTRPIGVGPHCSATCADQADLRIGNPSREMGQRPKLYVTNAAIATEWLRVSVGAGQLAGMFARGDTIVHTPREDEDGYVPLSGDPADEDGPAQVRPIRAAGIAARVQHTHYVIKRVKRGDDYVDVPALFPASPANMITEAPDMAPNLRQLRGVIHTPILRPDGTLVEAPGYDPATRLLHLPEPGLIVPPVPDQPTREHVASAVSLLDTMTAGFQWTGDHDRANYYGLLLTPLLRTLVPPPYKLCAIGAPMRGSGKSLLAELARILHGGVFRVEMPEDEAELRKQITSILTVTTGPVVQFDNVSGVLRSSTLAGLLTSNVWEDRPLGSTDMVKTTNDRLWVITGNNVNLGGDLVRRTLWITIDPGVPDPHLRTDFAIKDLPGWTRTLRGVLLNALLTLIRAWIVAGRPTRPRGGDSYAHWIEAVDGILTHAGVPGVFDHADSAQQREGADDDEWATFLAAVYQARGEDVWTAKDLLADVDTGDLMRPGRIQIDALPAELADKAMRPGVGTAGIARPLGMWLRNRDGRWSGNLTVRSRGTDRHDKCLWRVEAAKGAGTAGTAGTISDPAQNRRDDIMPQDGQETFQHRPEEVPAVPAVPAARAPGSPPTPQPMAPTVTAKPCPACSGNGCGICAPAHGDGW